MRWESFPQVSSCTEQVRSHQELLLLPLHNSVLRELQPQEAANQDVSSAPVAQSLPLHSWEGSAGAPNARWVPGRSHLSLTG